MHRLRLAALGLHHESNTFVARQTDLDDFLAAGISRDAEIRDRYADSQASMAGFLDVEAEDVEVEPLLFTFPAPSGPISTGAFEEVCGEMIYLLRQSGPWDGVLLAQHGAAVCEAYEDADWEVTRRVRQIVGPHVPIGAALDLHANLSTRLIQDTTVTVGYRTNPHSDARIRAKECADLVVGAAKGAITPRQAVVRVAAIPGILSQNTADEPMKGLYARIDWALSQPGILSASVYQGFPYADVANLGMAAVAIHNGDPAAAMSVARSIGELAWSLRDTFVSSGVSSSAAILRCRRTNQGPVVLLDIGDNVGAGSPGASINLFQEARKSGLTSFLQSLMDPQAVAECQSVGLGEVVRLSVHPSGGQEPTQPIEITGKLVARHQGPFEDSTATHGGFRRFDPGATVALICSTGQTLVLHSKPIQNVSLEEYRVLGIEPRSYHVVVAKGVNAPRLAYQPIAAEIIPVATPGPTPAEVTGLRFHRRPVPLFPFESAIEEPFV